MDLSFFMDEEEQTPHHHSHSHSQRQSLFGSQDTAAVTLSQPERFGGHGNSNSNSGGGGGGGDGTKPCTLCHSLDTYIDEATGNLICMQCHTQSQVDIDQSQVEIMMDEALGLAGRTAGGNIVQTEGTRAKKDSEKAQERRRVKEANRKIVAQLPSVEDCIKGMQRVLKESCKIACHLAAIPTSSTSSTTSSTSSSNEQYHHVLETVKTLWQTYLKAWHDAAEYFSTYYPEVRFSFRDHFLSQGMKATLMKHLVFWTSQRLRQQLYKEAGEESLLPKKSIALLNYNTIDNPYQHQQQQRNQQQNQQHHVTPKLESPSYSPSSSIYKNFDTIHEESIKKDDDFIGQDNDDNDNDNVNANTSNNNDTNKQIPTYGNATDMPQIARMVRAHYPRRKQGIGKFGAALLLKPSMDMVAAMLCIALAPYGVTDSHIRSWIGNGSLPLLNAFRLLQKGNGKNDNNHDNNDDDNHDDYNYGGNGNRNGNKQSQHQNQQNLQKTLLPIQTFFKSRQPPSEHKLHSIITSLHIACEYIPRKIIIRTKQGTILESRSSKLFRPGTILTPSSVPITAARMVSELGFGQKVLNYTLALMAQPIARKFNPPLQNDNRDKNVVNVNDNSKADKEKVEAWLPQPINAARPDRLLDTSRLLAVIAVAVKLIPGWDRLKFCLPSSSNNNDNNNNDIDTDHDNGKDRFGVGSTRTKTSSTSRKRQKLDQMNGFVPRTHECFYLVKNGKTMEDYLEFLENNMIDTNHVSVPKLISSFQFPEPIQQEEGEDEVFPTNSEDQGRFVQESLLPSDTYLDIPTEDKKKIQMSGMRRTVFRYEVTEARKRRRRGQIDFVVDDYNNNDNNDGNRYYFPNLEGPFRRLVEFMSQKFEVQPSQIEDYVAKLDMDMQKKAYKPKQEVLDVDDAISRIINPSN